MIEIAESSPKYTPIEWNINIQRIIQFNRKQWFNLQMITPKTGQRFEGIETIKDNEYTLSIQKYINRVEIALT